MSDLVESARRLYLESCSDVSQTTDTEPQIECDYCGHRDVGDSHYESCPAALAVLLADRIEQLEAKHRKIVGMKEWLKHDRGYSVAECMADVARRALAGESDE